jgi:hypothetical protein
VEVTRGDDQPGIMIDQGKVIIMNNESDYLFKVEVINK